MRLAGAGLAGAAAIAAPPATAPIAPGIVLEGAARQGALLTGRAPPGATALRLDGMAVPLAPDGRFLAAFDRDAPPTALLEAELPGGGSVALPLAVAPRAWAIQSLPTLPQVPVPGADFQRRRPDELRRIAAARALEPAAEGWRQRFRWPVTGRISGVFGSQRIYAGEPGAYHSGVDVARPAGTPIVAPADGVVVLAAAAAFTLEGHLLIVDHGLGLSSAFLHLSRIDVAEGQRVAQGQPLGAIGATGRATGPHLHWGMTWRGRRIDPAPIAGPMPPG